MVIPLGAPACCWRGDMAIATRSQLRDPKGGPQATADDIRSLPATVEWLRREGLLMETDVEVSGDLELTGVQKHFDGSYPILFNNVKGYPHARAITNLFANMDIVDRLFGYKDATDRTRRLAHALTHPIPSEVIPRGGDELGAAGAVQGFPTRLVKARTVDAYAVADSEYVLEGYLYPKDKRYETKEAEEHDTQGRFHFHPEWAGYMGKAYRTQSFHVTGITMRKRASRPLIYPMGVHMYDCNNIDTTVREAAFYELCDRIQPGLIKDVNIPFPMTDWAGCILQVKKRLKTDDGWVRNFIAASMACSAGLRLCIAVDADVDIYSMDDIIWSLTTRVNPNQDLLKPVPGGAGQTFIPSERVTARSAEWTGLNTRV